MVMDYLKRYMSPVGELTLQSDGEALTGLWIEGQRYFPEGLEGKMAELPAFSAAVRWLDLYFSGSVPDFLPPLRLEGTAFRKRVWSKLLEIPYGCVRTYGEIARGIAREDGRKTWSAQAAGGAVGHNPVSIIVPCHRVLGSDGSLTGYAGGIDKKLWLLRHEGAKIQSQMAGQP